MEQTILQSLFTLGRRCRLARSYGPCWLERYIEADEADYRFDSLNVVSNAAWPSVFSLVVLSAFTERSSWFSVLRDNVSLIIDAGMCLIIHFYDS